MYTSGVVPAETASESEIKYTVPVIHHMPSNTYVMDSALVSQFLESNYPDPPVPLTSELGREIEAKTRGALVKAFSTSLMPREMGILSPRAQEYFRRTREALLGHPLEDQLAKEEESWGAVDDDLRTVSELIQTSKADGRFVLGVRPSYTDFLIAGAMQTARVVEEGVFQRLFKYPGFKDIYEACLPYMEKKD